MISQGERGISGEEGGREGRTADHEAGFWILG